MWPYLKGILPALVVAVIVVGCANPYETSYRPINVSSITPPAQFTGEPRLEAASSDNGRSEIFRMYQDGYGLIGVSAFVSEAHSASEVLAQAKKVGAAVVVVQRKYRNTETGVRTIDVPTVNTVDSSGTIYGSGGSASYSSTSTVYGTRTEAIPYSADKFTHEALYFVPLQRVGPGILMSPMTDEQKRIAETNQGSAVVAVRKDSPAYKADIVPGDIILSIDGYKILDRSSTAAALDSTQGREATYVLMRNGRRLEKKVAVPVGTW